MLTPQYQANRTKLPAAMDTQNFDASTKNLHVEDKNDPRTMYSTKSPSTCLRFHFGPTYLPCHAFWVEKFSLQTRFQKNLQLIERDRRGRSLWNPPVAFYESKMCSLTDKTSAWSPVDHFEWILWLFPNWANSKSKEHFLFTCRILDIVDIYLRRYLWFINVRYTRLGNI